MKPMWIILFTIAVYVIKINAEEPKNLNPNDCGIVNLTAPFLFVERSEKDVSLNPIIGTKEIFNVRRIVSNSTKIKMELEESSPRKVNFVMKTDLIKHRYLEWDPVLETSFTFVCNNNATYPMTFVFVVKDENLDTPCFQYSGYTINIPDEDLSAETICLTTRVPIVVTDYDYNLAYSNLTVECQDYHKHNVCERIQLLLSPKVGTSIKGNKYELVINFSKKGKAIEKELKFKIDVTDGLYKNHTNIVVKLGGQVEYEESDFPVLPVGLGIGSLVAMLLGVVGFMGYKKKKVENTLRKLTEVEIREFEQGTANISAAGKRSIAMDVNAPIMSLPYQRQFDIPRENLRIDETSILGTGAFGIVMKGTVHQGRENITVAVKTVKRNVGVLYFKALLSELKIMAYIDKHKNVVSLIGACTHNIRKRELYIAVEYCANGNFQSYLKCRKDSFDNLVVDGILTASQNPGLNGAKHSFTKSISTYDLLQWAYQIANGMEFLRSKNVIHGDLAARNILLDEHRVAKIADFGLSRRIVDYHSNYYHTKTSSTTPLPWKWMAPESLKYMTFSHKSDIWSFGIVLWETFTLAQTPYPGLSWSENFVDRLTGGLRMTKPEFATDSIYDMIVDCWNIDPGDRPVIDDLKRQLESMINSVLQQQGYGYMRVLGNQPYISMMNDTKDAYLLQDRYTAPIYC